MQVFGGNSMVRAGNDALKKSSAEKYLVWRHIRWGL
jgi:hypothetical protein